MKNEEIKPLTREQVVILKKTFRLMDADSLANRFYTKLFAKRPEVRPMFTKDMAEMRTKLMSVFELVVFSFTEQEPGKFYIQKDVLAPLRTLGKKHTEKGVLNNHYPIANDLLMQSIKEEAGYVFPQEAEEAWELALLHLTAAMLNLHQKSDSLSNLPTLRDSFNYIKEKLFKA